MLHRKEDPVDSQLFAFTDEETGLLNNCAQPGMNGIRCFPEVFEEGWVACEMFRLAKGTEDGGDDGNFRREGRSNKFNAFELFSQGAARCIVKFQG